MIYRPVQIPGDGVRSGNYSPGTEGVLFTGLAVVRCLFRGGLLAVNMHSVVGGVIGTGHFGNGDFANGHFGNGDFDNGNSTNGEGECSNRRVTR